MYVIGLDIGGTKIEGILVKSTAGGAVPNILKKIRMPTQFRRSGMCNLRSRFAKASAGKQAVISNIVSVVVSLYRFGRENIRGFKLSGVGIGTAGFLKGGRLEMVPNIPAIKGIRLKEVLLQKLQRRKIKVQLYVENDSICFALAEFMFGAARGCEDVIGVIVGTGIGSGLILDGRLYKGRDGGAGHIGHTTIDPSGPKCGCGQRGHFESWCSGRHITLRYIAAGGKMTNPDPKKIFHSNEAVARKVMAETYDKFGIALPI